MPLPEPEADRLQMLRNRSITPPYAAHYYGLPEGLLNNGDFLADFNRYRSTLTAPGDIPAGQIDRYALEGFFDAIGVLPPYWAAARLGLRPEYVTRLLGRLAELPLPRAKQYLYYGCLVDKSLSEDLVRCLPALRFHTFSDHESFCRQLHHALMQALHMTPEEVQAASWWCATNEELGDYPRRYGYHVDCLTCQPLSSAHAIWLDLGKPLNLGPDRCSRLFFVRHAGDLRQYVRLGRHPREGLERYEEFVQAAG